MNLDDRWKRVHELRAESAKAHQAYLALVGPPELMKMLPTTPEESRAIEKALERCNQVDEALSAAMKVALDDESTR